jgi:hypothetical protein
MQKTLALAAAWLFMLSLLTGVYAAQAMNGSIPVEPHAALAAHLDALLAVFLLLGAAWSLPFTRLGARGQKWLAWSFIVPSYANWAITALKAWLHVPGLALTGEPANDGVFLGLLVFVVGPSLASAGGWIYALSRKS